MTICHNYDFQTGLLVTTAKPSTQAMTEICVLCDKPISDGETVINNHSWWYHHWCWVKYRNYMPPTAPFTYQGEPMDKAITIPNGSLAAPPGWSAPAESIGMFRGEDTRWKISIAPKETQQGEPMDETQCNGRSPAPLEGPIRAMCQKMADFLVEKNRAYGNSVGDPCGIFARRADPLLQMDVRIDDKINRLRKGSEYPGDDTVTDLIGYLILRQIVAEQQKQDGAK